MKIINSDSLLTVIINILLLRPTLLIIVFISSILSSSFLKAQPANWSIQTTSNFNTLNDIFFINDFQGWACGNNGAIIHTADGGNNWEMQYEFGASSVNYNSIFFIDENNGWIAGNASVDVPITLLRTTDGGANWNETNIVSMAVNLNGVYFLNPMTGWVVGEFGRVYRTDDSGISWVLQSGGFGTGTLNTTLYDIHFVDGMNGWISAAQGRMYHTSDGGINWTLQQSPITLAFRNVQFIDSLNGWVAGGCIRHTSDGGNNWVFQCDDLSETRDVHFIDNLNGWAAGGFGSATIYRTTNGGLNWVSEGFFSSLDIYNGFNAIHFTSPYRGWAVWQSGHVLHYSAEDESTSIEERINGERIATSYPNPFTESTTLKFNLNQSEKVLLEIYDMLGKRLETLVDATLGASSHQYTFDGEAFPAGMYVYQLQVGEHAESGKLILSK